MVSTGDAAANQIPSCALLHFAFTRRLFVAVADLIVACGSFSLWWMTGAPSTGACSFQFFSCPKKGLYFGAHQPPTPFPPHSNLKSPSQKSKAAREQTAKQPSRTSKVKALLKVHNQACAQAALKSERKAAGVKIYRFILA